MELWKRTDMVRICLYFVWLIGFHFNLLQITAKLVTLVTFTATRIMVRWT